MHIFRNIKIYAITAFPIFLNFTQTPPLYTSLTPTLHRQNETQGGVTDYVEIACIPPLPLYALLAVDNDAVCLVDNDDNSGRTTLTFTIVLLFLY